MILSIFEIKPHLVETRLELNHCCRPPEALYSANYKKDATYYCLHIKL